MVGSAGSYVPTVTGGQDLYQIKNFTSQVEAYPNSGSNYTIEDLQTIIQINFDVLTNKFVVTTNSGTGNNTVS